MLATRGSEGERVCKCGSHPTSTSLRIEIREGRELMVASSSRCRPFEKTTASTPAQKTYAVLPTGDPLSYEYDGGELVLKDLLTGDETSVPCPCDVDFVYDEDGHGCLVMPGVGDESSEEILDSVFMHEVLRDEASELHIRVTGSWKDPHCPKAIAHDEPNQSECVA